MSQASISTFMQSFQGGGARSNRYQVDFHFPIALKTISKAAEASSLLRVACKATTIPNFTTGLVPIKYMGRTIKIPGDREFDDWSITVLNDITPGKGALDAFTTRGAFEQWSNAMLGQISNLEESGTSVMRDFYGHANVWQYDRKDNIVAQYSMEMIFPTSVGAITLGYDNDNQIEEFEVTFALNQWTSINTDLS